MSNKKQTAVDWLVEQILDLDRKGYALQISKLNELGEQAKELEKEQMDIVSEEWWNEGASYMYDGKTKYESFEQYYKETYEQ